VDEVQERKAAVKRKSIFSPAKPIDPALAKRPKTDDADKKDKALRHSGYMAIRQHAMLSKASPKAPSQELTSLVTPAKKEIEDDRGEPDSARRLSIVGDYGSSEEE
jgi:hypothetical protein